MYSVDLFLTCLLTAIASWESGDLLCHCTCHFSSHTTKQPTAPLANTFILQDIKEEVIHISCVWGYIFQWVCLVSLKKLKNKLIYILTVVCAGSCVEVGGQLWKSVLFLCHVNPGMSSGVRLLSKPLCQIYVSAHFL